MIRYATLTYLKKMSVLLVFSVLLSSCTIYQNIPDDDGIYTTRRNNSRVVVVERNSNTNKATTTNNQNTYTGSNAFTRELERIDRINGTDIITDIENYSSFSDTIVNETDDNDHRPRSWGNSDTNDVVVNINLTPNNFGWGVWDPWIYDPYFNWGFNGWGWNNWGWNGWANQWGWGVGVFPRWGFGWGWNNPYVNPFGGFHPFYHGLHWRRFNQFRFNDFNSWQQYRYGRRVAYNGNGTLGRRGFASNNFNTLNRRGNSTINNNNSNNRRSSVNQSNQRRNSSVRNSTINNSRRSSSNRSSVRPSGGNSRPSMSRGSSRGSSSRSGGRRG